MADGVGEALEVIATTHREPRRVCVAPMHVDAVRKGCEGARARGGHDGVDFVALVVASGPGVPPGADAVLVVFDLCTNRP